MDRQARVLSHVRQRRARQREPRRLDALDDGGQWVRCTGCDTHKRFDADAEEPITNWCPECSATTEHVHDRPSYATE